MVKLALAYVTAVAERGRQVLDIGSPGFFRRPARCALKPLYLLDYTRLLFLGDAD